MRFAYVILTYLLVPVVIGHLLWRSVTSPAYRQRIPERFGFGFSRLRKPSIWVHAVSIGEVQAAAPLVRALQQRYPEKSLVVTSITPTGSERVRALFGDTIVHSYAPLDTASAVRRFFDWARPELVIIIETELWPNLYHECGQRRIPLVLASARVSPQSVRRYRLLIALFSATLSHGIVIAAQSTADAERFRSLGASAERTRVTGNIKFDFELPPRVAERGREFRLAQAPDRLVWIAASTHEHEEQILLSIHQQVLAIYPNALLLLVPRHPERFQSVAALIGQAGLSYLTRSSGSRCMARKQVFLGDSMGELTMFYAAADVAFVGGSLVPVGGHNLLEPAALGIPVLTGPHNFNAPDIAELLAECGAAQIVANAQELARQIIHLLGDQTERQRRGELGRAAVENNRGTLERLLQLIDPLLAPSVTGDHTPQRDGLTRASR